MGLHSRPWHGGRFMVTIRDHRNRLFAGDEIPSPGGPGLLTPTNGIVARSLRQSQQFNVNSSSCLMTARRSPFSWAS